MIELFYTADFWIALSTLIVLEIVLGIDNLIFLTIVTNTLPKNQQKSARRIGLALACIMRLGLLAALNWMMQLTNPLFVAFNQAFSLRDLILIIGGAFLLVKATQEMHQSVLGIEEKQTSKTSKQYLYLKAIFQIVLLDIIFSLDSVITAIGLAQEFLTMALAIIISVIAMVFASEPLGRFINKYPTLKILALSFLLLIGTVLIADGFKFHIPRGYIYFAIAFSILVESLNLIARKKQK